MQAALSPRDALDVLGVDPRDKRGDPCDDEALWRAVRKAWRLKASATHPDHGGCREAFERAQAAYSLLQQRRDSGLHLVGDGDGDDAPRKQQQRSWDKYRKASSRPTPSYRVEVAVTGRATCQVDGDAIDEGEVKVVSLMRETGGYSRPRRIANWRVPESLLVALGGRDVLGKAVGEASDAAAAAAMVAGLLLGDRRAEVTLVLGGLDELSEGAMEILAEHISAAEHWSAEPSAKQKASRAKAASGSRGGSQGEGGGAEGGGGEGALEEYKEAFLPPFPDVDGVRSGQLAKAVVLLTGTFAEMASAAPGALDKGKAQVKQLVELFGGRVVSGMSKRVTHLVLGCAPGASKLAAARSAGVALVTLETLCDGLRQNDVEAAVRDAGDIVLDKSELSKGFAGKNAVACSDRIAEACGVGPGRLEDKNSKKRLVHDSAESRGTPAKLLKAQHAADDEDMA